MITVIYYTRGYEIINKKAKTMVFIISSEMLMFNVVIELYHISELFATVIYEKFMNN